jgi:carbamoyltransferase
MLVVGALVERTSTGVDPVDGGVAIWEDGAFRFVQPEERVTRVKYAGGFRGSLRRGLSALGKTLHDVDVLSFASYGESRPVNVDHIVEQAPELQPVRDRIWLCGSHHELHALYGFRHSPFEHALIAVLDNEGLVLGAQKSESPFASPMERCSYFLGGPTSVDLLTRDLFGSTDVSLGEAFRRFNYYCGFPSHQFSGKTMALAGYGDLARFSGLSLISRVRDQVHVHLDPDPTRPAESVVAFFAQRGIDIAPPRSGDQPIHRDHIDAAAFVQREIEEFIIERITQLADSTKANAVVLAGGVAYNCRMVGLLERRLRRPVFVPPSPGDQGICIGAVHCWLESRGHREHVQATSYLGGEQRLTESRLSVEDPSIIVVPLEYKPGFYLAELLKAGRVVAVVEGPSECGRRALGHRSLLAYPSESSILQLRAIKHREWFRPFGVSVLSSFAEVCFGGQFPDPFMLRATILTPGASAALEHVIHVDRSIRAQAVKDDESSALAGALRELSISGLEPVVLNTSLNSCGAPLVETADEAYDFFLGSPAVGALVLVNDDVALVRQDTSL